jgi:hypothetical protein
LRFEFRFVFRIALVVALAVVTFALFPVPADAAEGAEPPTSVSHPADAFDLWRIVRHRQATSESGREERSFVVVPSVSSRPSTGLSGGVSGEMTFINGDRDTTHPSSLAGSFKISSRKQVLSGVRAAVFTADDRWLLHVDSRMWQTSLDTYALGTAAAGSGAASMDYGWLRLYGTAYRRVGSGVFVGAGLNLSDHYDVRPSATRAPGSGPGEYAAYSSEHGLAMDRQVSSGANVGLLFDTRDNTVNATRGLMAGATYRSFFEGFLGGTSTWQQFSADVRTYRPLTRDARHRLAFWFLGDFVTAGTAPYFDLPATGSDGRSARGYAEGRFRGPHLVYGELEYRGSLVRSGLVGAVAFLNVTTVDGDAPGQKLFRSFAPGGGVGVRVLLNKHSRTNFCVDYGWGTQGSRGLYLAVQEAF